MSSAIKQWFKDGGGKHYEEQDPLNGEFDDLEDVTDEENEKLAKANAEESMALAELVAECEKKMEKATAITEQTQK